MVEAVVVVVVAVAVAVVGKVSSFGSLVAEVEAVEGRSVATGRSDGGAELCVCVLAGGGGGGVVAGSAEEEGAMCAVVGVVVVVITVWEGGEVEDWVLGLRAGGGDGGWVVGLTFVSVTSSSFPGTNIVGVFSLFVAEVLPFGLGFVSEASGS